MKLREQLQPGPLPAYIHQWLMELVRRVNNDKLDVMIDDDTKGVILQSPDGHYWRVKVSNAGALTTTDLGTDKP